MKINGNEYTFADVSRILTVPDCNVLGSNKLGIGHGEAKFYFGTKEVLNGFALGEKTMRCFFLRSDLLTYLEAAKKEYEHPSQDYIGKDKMPLLWAERVQKVSTLPEMIFFTVEAQTHLEGPRGYVNSEDVMYRLFREISLPLISYITIMRLKDSKGQILYYWKLFVDYEALESQGKTPLVFKYGREKISTTSEETQDPKSNKKKKTSSTSVGRDAAAQAKYRERLLEECPYCPITMISDERLLLASHIKPYSVSEPSEEFDPKNGFTLSPLYDKLFDQGFISFDSQKRMMVSNWISPSNQERCHIKNGIFIQHLPLDEKREFYLNYHRKFVFKG